MDNQVNTLENSRIHNSQQNIKTVLDSFYHWETTQPHRTYLKQPFGKHWKDYTWQEVGKQARRMATALKSLNLPPQSNIGLISKNCAHWIITDLAISMAGHVSVPFYPSLIAPQLEQVLEHSQVKLLFIGKLDIWEQMKAGIPSNMQVIAFPQYPGNDLIEGEGYLHWDDLQAEHPPMKENYRPSLKHLRTIVYTSGTTGNPKGVMFDYLSNAVIFDKAAEALEITSNECRFFSYLPLCHIAERALVEGGSLYSGGTMYFAESLETFTQNLREAQPTHFLAVPRIWSKFQLGVLEKIPQKKLDKLLKLPIIAGMVKRKIRKTLGLNNAQVILTGAAPMPSATIEWFKKLDIHIQEVYGMTENGGGCTIMPKDAIKIGTVGKPYSYVDLKIDEDNQEVLMKSAGVTKGYYREPALTQALFKGEWLRTGDMGTIDDEGYLKITGRVKDMFKSAKGEYVVPGPIEWQFAVNHDLEQVCVLGTGLPQPIALATLSDIGKAKSRDEVEAILMKNLENINENLVNYQRIKKIILVRGPWSIKTGTLTPTLKIKRNQVEARYQTKLAAWYEQTETILWE